MDPLTILIVIGGALFLLSRSGGLSGFGLGTGTLGSTPTNVAPQAIPSLPVPTLNPNAILQEGAQTQQGIQQATGAISSALSSVSSISSGVLKAIPIVGSIVSAVAGVFFAASAARAKAATSENQAVAAAVPPWDQNVQQIVQLFNSKQINAAGVATLSNAIMSNYFMEVGPQIQSGRNGCNSGNMSKAQADAQFPGLKQCSGSWGAACCVGYADLWNGVNNMIYAAKLAENTGKPTPAVIPAVFASKYGGTNRPQYTVTFA